MASGDKTRARFEADQGDGALPIPAIAGPLLGLGYIVLLPFVGVATSILAIGYQGTESLAAMWRRQTQAVVDAREKTTVEAASFRELLQLLIDRTECEFMLVDREFRITQYCAPLRHQKELPERTEVGKHCFEVSHGRNGPCASLACECPLRRVLETNEQVAVKHYHENQFERGGAQRLVEVVATPVRDREGNITHVAQLISDASNV